MLKLTHANMNGPLLINPGYVIAVYESTASQCTHVVTEAQVWPVKETLIEILTAVKKLEVVSDDKRGLNESN